MSKNAAKVQKISFRVKCFPAIYFGNDILVVTKLQSKKKFFNAKSLLSYEQRHPIALLTYSFIIILQLTVRCFMGRMIRQSLMPLVKAFLHK